MTDIWCIWSWTSQAPRSGEAGWDHCLVNLYLPDFMQQCAQPWCIFSFMNSAQSLNFFFSLILISDTSPETTLQFFPQTTLRWWTSWDRYLGLTLMWLSRLITLMVWHWQTQSTLTLPARPSHSLVKSTLDIQTCCISSLNVWVTGVLLYYVIAVI